MSIHYAMEDLLNILLNKFKYRDFKSDIQRAAIHHIINSMY